VNSFAQAGPTDVSNIVGHWCFAIHPLVKHHIASNYNTRTIGRPNNTAATVIVGLENHNANGRRSNDRRCERRGQPPRIKKDIPPEKSPVRGGAAATNVLDKDAKRLLISVGADMIKIKSSVDLITLLTLETR
jgi:hypothetical protein